jgi:hypothetical protein
MTTHKFKIGDWVWITHTATRQLYKITARNGGYYRLKGNKWWEEDRLVLATPTQLAKMTGG